MLKTRNMRVPRTEKEKRVPLWKVRLRQFFRHRVGLASLLVLAALYVTAAFAPFFAPYGEGTRHTKYIYAPPQVPQFVDAKGNFHWRPFVYGLEPKLDVTTFQRTFAADTEAIRYLRIFVRGEPYKLFGFLASDIHLFGVTEGALFLFGTDRLGRDLYSRVLFGARISLTIGLFGVTLMLVLGSFIGIASGYYGGIVDASLQRLVEVVMSFPSIPLWMALAAAVPPEWSPVRVFFAVTIILALIRWVNLARQVRGLTLALRDAEYVQAAKALGASDLRIIVRHIFPNTLAYILIIATLAIPSMILAETALSFLGLGIQPPAVSWGSLLSEAQSIQTLLQNPWLLIPGLFVIVTVLSFNFVGDALRDAIDPKSY